MSTRSSTARAGTLPSGWMARYSGLFCSPCPMLTSWSSYSSPASSSALIVTPEQAMGQW